MTEKRFCGSCTISCLPLLLVLQTPSFCETSAAGAGDAALSAAIGPHCAPQQTDSEVPISQLRGVELRVAASDSTPTDQAQADFICDGLDDHVEIQQAIDAMPPDGGVVALSNGQYNLRAGIRLRSHITLRGAAGSAVLEAGSETKSTIIEDVSSPQSHVIVAAARGFKVGMECLVRDDDSCGWTGVFRTIVAINDDTITLDRDLDGIYTVDQHALLVNAFPLIDVHAKGREGDPTFVDVVIENLTLDGNNANVGCYGLNQAGILISHTTHSIIRNVVILDSNGDGISDQGAGLEAHNQILDNVVLNAATKGIHLGSRISHDIVRGNRIHGTGSAVGAIQVFDPSADGLYFCYRVRYCVIMDNVIVDNFGHGIGGLGPPDGDLSDRFNLIVGNTITDNQLNGIDISTGGAADPAEWGGSNQIIGNLIADNGWAGSGWHGIEIEHSADNVIIDNTVVDNHGSGIRIAGASGNVISGNIIGNNHIRGIHLCDASHEPLIPPNGNLLCHNNFLEVTPQHARDEGENTWFHAGLRTGNYWSDFDESNEGAYDEDNDGRADVPYVIPGGDNRDSHPLMNECEPELAAILDSNPPDGAIDARQRTEPDGAVAAGWRRVELILSHDAGDIRLEDFVVREDPPGVAPRIINLAPYGHMVSLELDRPVSPGVWTSISHTRSGAQVRLGYFPGDVDSDGNSTAADILRAVDCLNTTAECEHWQCDIDRDGLCGALDIMRLIEFLHEPAVIVNDR